MRLVNVLLNTRCRVRGGGLCWWQNALRGCEARGSICTLEAGISPRPPSDVEPQHGSICSPLVFSRARMKLHGCAADVSQAETWPAAIGILNTVWGGGDDKSFSPVRSLGRPGVCHEKEPREPQTPDADVKAHRLTEEGYSVNQRRHEGEIQNGRKD